MILLDDFETMLVFYAQNEQLFVLESLTLVPIYMSLYIDYCIELVSIGLNSSISNFQKFQIQIKH